MKRNYAIEHTGISYCDLIVSFSLFVVILAAAVCQLFLMNVLLLSKL